MAADDLTALDVLDEPIDGAASEVIVGRHIFEDGAEYVGEWNNEGLRHGTGQLKLPDGTIYRGQFRESVCSGIGVVKFPDGTKYEGEFLDGWFHGHGIFWRRDGATFTGEFKGGRIWGCGLVTFCDGSHGFPRNEGVFRNCRFIKKQRCPETVLTAQKVASGARQQAEIYTE